MRTLATMATVGLALSVGVANTSILGGGFAWAGEGLVGKWRDSVKDGTQETLDLYPNSAYRSVTVIVDPKAWRAALERDYCRRGGPGSGRAKSKEACDKTIEEMGSILNFPSVFIGTYVTDAARIAFTHGCAEGVKGCMAGDRKDAGIFFIDGDTLTIKLDGQRYKRTVIGGDTSTYTRVNVKTQN